MKKENEYSSVRIGKVLLVNGGLKGCKVEYEKVEKVGEREYRNVFNPTMKYPVQEEMLTCFGWLRGHLLAICGYDEKDVQLIENLEITGVRAGDGGFVIMGKLGVYYNGKVVSLVSPYTVNEEEYSGYSDVMKIIEGIYEETKEYLNKTRIMQDRQLVISYYKGDATFDKEGFLRLDEKEQKLFATYWRR